MKLFCLLLCTLPLLCYTYPAEPDAAVADEKSIALDDVEVDNEQAETAGDSQIQKRSGSNSFDYISHLKSSIFSSLGHASASVASGSSGGSSGGGGGGSFKSLDSGHHGNSVDYDPWSFKKSVLNTIFQAVKAITGGVTALKGQLIKGSGYALSAGGRLVASSGDKVTDVGKSIINSAQINSHSYGTSGHSSGGSVHPFKLSSASSGSSSSSDGGGGAHGGHVLHTDTITTYEIPAGHSSYGPPSKPPTYSSATHQYLPPVGPGYAGGGAPFSSGGHVAFEAPQSHYLPTNYGHDGGHHNVFNIYPRHKPLNEQETRKAAHQLQEILSLLPKGKTAITAAKTVTFNTGISAPTGPGAINPAHVEVHPNSGLGPIESLSHTEAITASYGPPQKNPSDVYRQMAKKQTPEEVYILKHPNEGYDYQRPKEPDTLGYKYNNYHAASMKNALQDLTPIIAALAAAKRQSTPATDTQYPAEESMPKLLPPPAHSLPPAVQQQSKFIQFDPSNSKADRRPVYTNSYKVRRQVPSFSQRQKRLLPMFRPHDYEIQDPLLFNRMLTM